MSQHLPRAGQGSLAGPLHKELAQMGMAEGLSLILEQTASIKIHPDLQ